MLLTYTSRNGPISFGTTFSIPLSYLKSHSLHLVVRDRGRDVEAFKLDFLFKEAENVEETIFLNNLLADICSHKKMVCMCVDREAQKLPYRKEYSPNRYCQIGGWLYEGQTIQHYDNIGGVEMCMWSIFHKLVFETVKDSRVDIREIRLELDSDGYYYAIYKYVDGKPLEMMKTSFFEGPALKEMVDRFLVEAPE